MEPCVRVGESKTGEGLSDLEPEYFEFVITVESISRVKVFLLATLGRED